jgi:hypothetical protein
VFGRVPRPRRSWATGSASTDRRHFEYIIATVTQSGSAKVEIVQPLFVSVAGLHFEGADAPKAREWVLKALDAGGGDTEFGPAKFRVSGDISKMVLEIKASGSDW